MSEPRLLEPANSQGPSPVPRTVVLSFRGRRKRYLPKPPRRTAGFTLVELVTVVAIIAALAALAIPAYQDLLDIARVAATKGDLRGIETAINAYAISNDVLPDSLADVGYPGFKDPWGRPLQYVKFDGAVDQRLDRFGTSINTDFDLYSLGHDGVTTQKLQDTGPSADDVVRGGDGSFLGLGKDF